MAGNADEVGGDGHQAAAAEQGAGEQADDGHLGPAEYKGVVMTVIRRSRSFSMVREAMTPGTPQPEPMSMGIKLLPLRPNLRKIRSMMNATRAM